jgi:hypothetical protein
VKHLYGNWRDKYPRIELKEVLWMAARAPWKEQCNESMRRLEKHEGCTVSFHDRYSM